MARHAAEQVALEGCGALPNPRDSAPQRYDGPWPTRARSAVRPRTWRRARICTPSRSIRPAQR